MLRLRKNDLAELSASATSRADFLVRAWELYLTPGHQLQSRLFFSLAGAAMEDLEAHSAFLGTVVTGWTPTLAALGRAEGLSDHDAQSEAWLLVAAFRGLLLDMFLTGDQAAARQAFEALLRMVTPSVAS
ncbi:hypothetical protein [Micromonospora sp. RP3T]|uniref:hypothetical protein n=1 Tax=Micromonospora sp. RP3T TaxID=2135446 RepID=UPI003D714576